MQSRPIQSSNDGKQKKRLHSKQDNVTAYSKAKRRRIETSVTNSSHPDQGQHKKNSRKRRFESSLQENPSNTQGPSGYEEVNSVPDPSTFYDFFSYLISMNNLVLQDLMSFDAFVKYLESYSSYLDCLDKNCSILSDIDLMNLIHAFCYLSSRKKILFTKLNPYIALCLKNAVSRKPTSVWDLVNILRGLNNLDSEQLITHFANAEVKESLRSLINLIEIFKQKKASNSWLELALGALNEKVRGAFLIDLSANETPQEISSSAPSEFLLDNDAAAVTNLQPNEVQTEEAVFSEDSPDDDPLLMLSPSSKPSLSRLKAELKLNLTEAPTILSLKHETGIKEAQVVLAKEGIIFEKQEKLPLYITRIAGLGNGYGVCASEDLFVKKRKHQNMGRYHGERIANNDPETDEGKIDDNDPETTEEKVDDNDHVPAYSWELPDGTLVDAEKIRNHTAFVNHSSTDPNIYVWFQEYRKGQYSAHYALLKDIPKDGQLLVSYGLKFFPLLKPPIIPNYLHVSDNWETPDDICHKYRDQYAENIYLICQEITTPFKLNSFIIMPTKLFVAVFENDVAEVTRLLKQGSADLPTYSVVYRQNAYQLLPMPEQQRITPLMLACYLGHEDIVLSILQNGQDIDINRCMLQQGDTAISCLIKGKGSEDTKINLAHKLLEKGARIDIHDREGITALESSICLGYTKLVEVLLNGASQASSDCEELLDLLFEAGKENIVMHCFRRSDFEMLKVIIKFCPQDYINEKIKNNKMSLDFIIEKSHISALSMGLPMLLECLSVDKNPEIATLFLEKLYARYQALLNGGTEAEEILTLKNIVHTLLMSLNQVSSTLHEEWRNKFSFPELFQSNQSISYPPGSEVSNLGIFGNVDSSLMIRNTSQSKGKEKLYPRSY